MEIEFYYLLKIATAFGYGQDVQDAMIDLMELIGHPRPERNNKIEVSW